MSSTFEIIRIIDSLLGASRNVTRGECNRLASLLYMYKSSR